MAEKNYKAFTGLKEFYYGTLDETGAGIITETAPERIHFLQNVSVETPQEVVKAHGDNTVAEMAVSTDVTNLTTTFHKIPIEDRAKLYGYKTVNGMYGLSSDPTPPYVACIFARTAQDGGTEWLGFAKGIFTISTTESQTKGESIEFTGNETSGQFMPREIDGIDEDMTYLVAYDKRGETEQRDALFQAIFGVPHPEADPAA
ncbi:major tail protein [Oceanobacillus caeni]